MSADELFEKLLKDNHLDTDAITKTRVRRVFDAAIIYAHEKELKLLGDITHPKQRRD